MENDTKEASRARRTELKILGRITLDIPGAASGAGEGGSYLCNIINMSLTGALVECGHTMPVGSLVNYSFRMPGGEATVKVLAEVVRRERGSARYLFDEGASGEEEHPFPAAPSSREGINLYGIRFLDMKENVRGALKSYLKS
jgi:hypothetical protein